MNGSHEEDRRLGEATRAKCTSDLEGDERSEAVAVQGVRAVQKGRDRVGEPPRPVDQRRRCRLVPSVHLSRELRRVHFNGCGHKTGPRVVARNSAAVVGNAKEASERVRTTRVADKGVGRGPHLGCRT